ncbi:response regulator [Mucisphaera calidilacus]|uniref:Aerobic respiration control sensor protein ArcB n=1 Tax=Mucisphaera calidilacus TaxID=2527982 RepID=A0A518BZD4_9BACT|nr:response regulator [Mucisphaera calidilacus]QDU72337.1 aerobic respiration control sensor protein ArcB [Mucisphaera calidilacus]
MTYATDEERFLDTLRLPAGSVEKILAKLKQRERMHAGSEQRRHTRQPLKDCGNVLMKLTHPGGSTAQCVVLPRDFSAGGISLLHGSFVHTGTRVHIGLFNTQGERHWIVGNVVRCSYFEARVHELGIKFDLPVPVHEFLRAGADGESVRRELLGKVLYVEPSVDFRELLRFQCQRMGVSMTTTDTGEEAITMAQEIDFDAILTELDLPDTPGELVIKKLSRLRPKPAIVAMTSEDSKLGDILPSGCDALVSKPINEGDLYQLMATFLPSVERLNETDALCSTFWSDAQLRPVIAAFVERLPESLGVIRSMLGHDEETDELIAEVQRLRNAAGGYGYPDLNEALNRLIRLIQTEGGTSDQELRSTWLEIEQRVKLASDFMQAQTERSIEDDIQGVAA